MFPEGKSVGAFYIFISRYSPETSKPLLPYGIMITAVSKAAWRLIFKFAQLNWGVNWGVGTIPNRTNPYK